VFILGMFPGGNFPLKIDNSPRKFSKYRSVRLRLGTTESRNSNYRPTIRHSHGPTTQKLTLAYVICPDLRSDTFSQPAEKT